MNTLVDSSRRLVAAGTDTLIALAGGLFGATAGAYFSFSIAAGQQADSAAAAQAASQADSAAAAQTDSAVDLFERSADQFAGLANLSGLMCLTTALFVFVLHLGRSAIRDVPTADEIASAVAREIRAKPSVPKHLSSAPEHPDVPMWVHDRKMEERPAASRATDALGWPERSDKSSPDDEGEPTFDQPTAPR